MKRSHPLTFLCSHEGCTEKVTYRYDTIRDLNSSYELRNYSGGRWKCLRHTKPESVLAETNKSTYWEGLVEQKQHGKFIGSSGFLHGPGFKFYSEDFPPGTKLIVKTEIIFPENEDEQASLG